MDPTYFETAGQLRAWFARHGATAAEIWVGFHKTGSGRRSVTWPEAVDEALAVGWIDGVRKRIDDDRYVIRFTPRRRRSTWSAVNVARVAELEREGRMTPAGRAAFEARAPERTAIYSYEQAAPEGLDAEAEGRLEAAPGARAFWEAQPPSYRKRVSHWVTSAKKPETRRGRLDRLVAACVRNERL